MAFPTAAFQALLDLIQKGGFKGRVFYGLSLVASILAWILGEIDSKANPSESILFGDSPEMSLCFELVSALSPDRAHPMFLTGAGVKDVLLNLLFQKLIDYAVEQLKDPEAIKAVFEKFLSLFIK